MEGGCAIILACGLPTCAIGRNAARNDAYSMGRREQCIQGEPLNSDVVNNSDSYTLMKSKRSFARFPRDMYPCAFFAKTPFALS